ncbi:MAG: ABC transporter substrate-binding protein [Desulfomonile tiedjei]|nr:ABC transporter substrate-binding protein [Desulfomonile tiedjei]
MKKCSGTLCLVVALIFTFAMAKAATAQETITVGMSLSPTGPPAIAATSEVLEAGIRDALGIANDEGGINGKKLRHVMQDDQYKPDVGARIFEEMVSKYNPLCFFGSGTPVALATAPLIRDRYKVLYTSTSFSAKLAVSGIPSMFVVGPTYGDQFAVALKYIAQQKKEAKVAFFYSKGPFGEDPLAYGRVMCQRLKMELVGEVAGDIRGGDHTNQIEQLKRQNPDFVIMQGWVGASHATLMKQCRDLGLKSEFVLTVWGADKSVVDALGPDGPTFLAVSPYAYWWMDDVPMIRKVKAYIAKHYPDVTYRPLNYFVTFTAGKVFVECLRKADAAGELNGEGVTKALQSLRDFDTGGLTPPLTIRSNRFPVARVLKSNPSKGTLEPVSDWITFY